MGAEGADLGGTLGPKPCADARSAIAGVKTLVNDRVSGSRRDERVPCAVGAGPHNLQRLVQVAGGVRAAAALTVYQRVSNTWCGEKVAEVELGVFHRQPADARRRR